jgi:hypothetical protein
MEVLCVCVHVICTVLYYCSGDFLGYTHTHTHIIWEYWTVGIVIPLTPHISPFIKGLQFFFNFRLIVHLELYE